MSNICASDVCQASEVGPFMQGITKACGNLGNCQLPDIMTVVANVGNYVLGLVGAVVLLMFVVGGFYFLTAGGNMDRVKTGKRYIVTSVVGLAIVFGAFAAVQTLKGVLVGTTATQNQSTFVLCTAAADEGQACGLNQVCKAGICTSQCDVSHPTGDYRCTDVNDPTAAGTVDTGSCEVNKCGGGASIQCCKVK
jgi:hypothetical protein